MPGHPQSYPWESIDFLHRSPALSGGLAGQSTSRCCGSTKRPTVGLLILDAISTHRPFHTLRYQMHSQYSVDQKHARRSPREAVRLQAITHDLQRPHGSLCRLAIAAQVDDLDMVLLVYGSLQLLSHAVRLQTELLFVLYANGRGTCK